MKKFLIMALFLLFFVTGCVGLPVIYECNCPKDEETEEEKPEIKEGDVKTGLSIVTNLKNSTGQIAEFDITLIAVTVNDEGVITSCAIDSVGTKIEFDTTGVIKTDINSVIKSKQELGDAYGMVAWGGAKHEWYEQVNSLASYCVGKTKEEVLNIAVNEATKPTDTDLSTSVTIAIGGYKNAIAEAVDNAKNLGANSKDKLHIAVNASISSSINASATKNGVAQLDVDFTAVTEKGGVITSCVIDSVQAKVEFDTTGTIKTNLDNEVLTKNELGANYGMVAWGGAIAEWNEQTAYFSNYVVGKTKEEVLNIAVNEATKPTDTDLSTSVTIAVGGFKALIAEALTE